MEEVARSTRCVIKPRTLSISVLATSGGTVASSSLETKRCVSNGCRTRFGVRTNGSGRGTRATAVADASSASWASPSTGFELGPSRALRSDGPLGSLSPSSGVSLRSMPWSRPMSVPSLGTSMRGSRAGSGSAKGWALEPRLGGRDDEVGGAEEDAAEVDAHAEDPGGGIGGVGMSITGPGTPRSSRRRLPALSERQAWGGRKRLRLGNLRHSRRGGWIMRRGVG